MVKHQLRFRKLIEFSCTSLINEVSKLAFPVICVQNGIFSMENYFTIFRSLENISLFTHSTKQRGATLLVRCRSVLRCTVGCINIFLVWILLILTAHIAEW